MGEAGSEGKSFDISKVLVWRAWMKVRSNKGAAGIDGQAISDFEQDEKNNLYRIWNRMSSGSYFPTPVMAVDIPKDGGAGVRTLGIPTVADRVAQTVVAMVLEPESERVFHPDSYGYRPARSAIQAVEMCKRRCWNRAWVIDLDIRAFFDTVPHDLVLQAVKRHTTLPWVVLYVRRWLTTPVQHPDGRLEQRDRGTPQGSAISPLLANLFMHYAFDVWMARTFPQNSFERYCDDAVIHCDSEGQAQRIQAALAVRLANVGLELHPDKTRIVYCPQDGRRPGRTGEVVEFTFLGFTFCRRRIRTKTGQLMLGFVPAISKKASKAIGRTIRWWRLGRCTNLELHQIARWINPIVSGWITYYGKFYKSLVVALLRRINRHLERWARRKYKRLRARPVETRQRIIQFANTHQRLFTHWQHGSLPT